MGIEKLKEFVDNKTNRDNAIYDFLEFMLADYIKTKIELKENVPLDEITENDFDDMVESLYNDDELFEYIDTVVSDTLYDKLYDKETLEQKGDFVKWLIID